MTTRELRRTCAKCNVLATRDSTLRFHRFPQPGKHGAVKARLWAQYCYPTKDWSSEESLKELYDQHKMVCSKHFDDSSYTSSARIRLNNFAIPTGAQGLLVKLRQEQNISLHEIQDTNTNIELSPMYGANIQDRPAVPGGADMPEGLDDSETKQATEDLLFSWQRDSEINFDDVNINPSTALGKNNEDNNDVVETKCVDITEINSLTEIMAPADEQNINNDIEKDEHESYKCDICSGPINRFRFSCVECLNYNLCAACVGSGGHPEHYLLRIPRPQPHGEIQLRILDTIRRFIRADLKSLRAEADFVNSLKNELKSEWEGCDPVKQETDDPITEETDDPIPEEPVYTVPEESVYTVPDESAYTVPDETVYPIPEESVYTAPDESAYTVPDESAYPVPDETVYPIPEEPVYTDPDESGNPVPDESAYPVPDETVYPIPEESVYTAPDESAYTVPDESAYPVPDETVYPIPEEPVYSDPDESANPVPDESAYRVLDETVYTIPDETDYPVPDETDFPVQLHDSSDKIVDCEMDESNATHTPAPHNEGEQYATWLNQDILGTCDSPPDIFLTINSRNINIASVNINENSEEENMRLQLIDNPEKIIVNMIDNLSPSNASGKSGKRIFESLPDIYFGDDEVILKRSRNYAENDEGIQKQFVVLR